MRASPIIEYSSTVLILCLWVGAITTVFSSLIGLFQQDIKKVIAYSTMSQLARKYKLNLIIFRHQTICEKVIEIIRYIIIYFILFKKVDFFRLSRRPLPTQCLKFFARLKEDKLNPWYLTGFVDGEGSFLINVRVRSDQELGYNVNLVFKLKIHSRDIKLLESIKNYLYKIENIIIRKDGYIEFIVSFKDIKVLNHFDTYPLMT